MPKAETDRADPLGLANARFYPGTEAAEMMEEGRESLRRELAAWRAAGHAGSLPTANFLAIRRARAFNAGVTMGVVGFIGSWVVGWLGGWVVHGAYRTHRTYTS